jgi:NAD(P)-dependent dehydrogenase (short-subunit alcohol dehydrogenase family)
VSGPVSMNGRVCVVTGATSGIGFFTALALARAGGSVVLVGRDPARTSDALARIAAASANREVRAVVADLLNQSEVRRLATEVRAQYPRIHVLVNNAGAVFSKRLVTADGLERTWALNVVAPFLLTHLLLPQLTEGAPARVVNVSSAAHVGARLDFDNLQGENGYRGYRAYSRSKLALILLTYEFARRLGETRVTANAVHPGLVASRLGQNNPGAAGRAWALLTFLFGIRPERGARTPTFVAVDPSVLGVTGKYFTRQHEAASSRASYDAAAGARLWDVLALQTEIPTDVLSRTV